MFVGPPARFRAFWAFWTHFGLFGTMFDVFEAVSFFSASLTNEIGTISINSIP